MALRFGAATAAQWYWLVGNRSAPDNIFSAPAAAYVSASDSGYEAFVAGGNTATQIPTDGELAVVLTRVSAAPALISAAMGSSPTWGETGAAPSPADICAVYQAAGCQVVSTANPSTLNGTYPLDPATQGDMTAIAAGINADKGLPGGGSTFNLLDVSGNPHPFGSSDFLNLAAALETYVYELVVTKVALNAGHSATWPAQPVTIA